MTKKFLLSWVLALLIPVPGTVHAQNTELPEASQILAQYKGGLQEALRISLGQGLVEALDACRVRAPDIAESLSQDDFRVGRSSHRLRNPVNTPPEWVAPVMHAYVANDTDREPRTVPLQDGRSGYVEPIILQPHCVACHGEVLDNEVALRINELYPEDQAVGFKVGDLRGVFWIEYPVSE